MLTGEELWSKVREGLQTKLSKPTFETFIRPTACSGFANGELRLLAPNPFAGVRLREQLLPSITQLASEACGGPVQVVVLADSAVISPGVTNQDAEPQEPASAPGDSAAVRESAPPRSPRRVLPGLNPRYVFGRFVVGPNRSVVFDEAENRLHAQKAVLAWCFAGN